MPALTPTNYVPPPDAEAIPQVIHIQTPDLIPGSSAYDERFGQLKATRQRVGPWAWDLLNGLRSPWNPVEEFLLHESFETAGEITSQRVDPEEFQIRLEERAAELVNWPLMASVRDWLDTRLEHYGRVLQLARSWESPSADRSNRATRDLETEIDNRIQAMAAPSHLWDQEHLAVQMSVEEFRVDKQLQLPSSGKLTAESAVSLVIRVLEFASETWRRCQILSLKTAQDLKYTRFAPTVELFLVWAREAPLASELQAALLQEFAAVKSSIRTRDEQRKQRSAVPAVPQIVVQVHPASVDIQSNINAKDFGEASKAAGVQSPPVGPSDAEADLPRSNESAKASDQKKLSRAVNMAYQSFEWAERQLAERGHSTITDADAYEWLREYGFEGYKLPPEATWLRYIRRGRQANDAQKYSRRSSRTGRSIVTPDELDRRISDSDDSE